MDGKRLQLRAAAWSLDLAITSLIGTHHKRTNEKTPQDTSGSPALFG